MCLMDNLYFAAAAKYDRTVKPYEDAYEAAKAALATIKAQARATFEKDYDAANADADAYATIANRQRQLLSMDK